MADDTSPLNSGHTGAGENSPTSKSAARKRRRWPIVLGILVLLVLLLILAIPSLLCTGPGVRLIESQINSRISGNVRIGRMSLGWFTPTELNDITLKDPSGDVVVGDVSVVTHRSIVNLLSNWHDLGKITIAVKTLNLSRDSNNQLNILQALASPHPAATQPATTQAAAAPANRVSGASSTLPGINTTLTLTLADTSFTAPELQPFHAANTRLVLGVDTLENKPIHIQFDTAAGLGTHALSKIHAVASIQAIADGKILPTDQMTGRVTAGITKLDLAALAPILSTAGVKLSPSGMLTLALAAKIPSSGTGSVVGNIVVDNAALTGALLKGDSPQLGTVRVPINASWQEDHYQINSLGIHTALGGASLTGQGSIATVLAVLHHQRVSNKTAKFNITAAASLAHTLAALPHVITLPAGITFSGGQTSLTAAITLGAAMPPSGHADAPTLPPVTSALKFDVHPLYWTLPNGGPKVSAGATGTVAFNTLGQPVLANIHLHVAQGTTKPADFSLVADLTPIKNGSLLPLNQLTGNLKLLVANLDLSAIDQILPRTSRSLVFHGVVNGQITVHAPEAGRGEISGPLTITDCALGGTLLKSDHPQIGVVTLPLSVSWQGSRFVVAAAGIQSDNVRMLVSGAVTLGELKAIQNHQADWGASVFHVRTYCNLGWFASSFRHTLALHKLGLRLRHGVLNLQADLTSDGQQSTGGETLTLTDLRGTWEKTPFVINPVLLGSNFHRHGAQWNLVRGIVEQAASAEGKPQSTPQLHILVTGLKQGSYALSLQAVLANLVQEAAPFVPFNGRTIGGTLNITGTAADIFGTKIPYQLNVALRELAVGLGQGQPTITEPSVAIHSAGTLLVPHGALAGAESTFGIQTADINIPSGTLQLTKTAAGWVVPAVQAHISDVDLPGVMKIAKMFSPALANADIGGRIRQSVIAASYKPGAVNITQLHLVLDNVSFRNTAPQASTAEFVEPNLTVDLAGQAAMGKATIVNISTLAISTSDGAMTLSLPKPMAIQTGTPMAATIPAFTMTAKLVKFVPLLEALGKFQAGAKLQGALVLHGALQSKADIITANFDGGVKSYQLMIPGSSANLPPDNITLAVSGSVNPSAATFTCLDNCMIGEHAVTGAGGDMLQLNKGSVLAWSYQSPENIDGALHYNLARIQALLGPLLPAGLTMTGQHTMKLQITGPLTADKGLREFRKLDIAPTALGFDKIAIDGLTLGPGEISFAESGGILRLIPSAIPANKGTLNTGGHIDFNLPTPEFIVSRPLTLVNNVQMNGSMGGTLLNFLPLTWGAGTQSAGLVQLSGMLNLQLQNANLPLEFTQLKKTGTLTGTVSATHITSDSPLFALITRSMGPFASTNGGSLALKDSGIRPTTFNLRNGKIYYQNLKMLLASFGMAFSGWVGLDQTLHQDVNISGAGVTVPIPLSIDGTTSKPKLHLSAKPLKNLGSDLGNTIKNAPTIINNLKGLFGH
ncbi:MAG: hypothetical protein ACP5I8_11010 [Phycisphaerae bacterium]